MDNFQTKRLIAERLRPEHFELIFQMHQDKKVMAHLGGKRSRQETEEYMDLNLAHWDKYGYGIWILTENQTGLFAGRGGLRNAVLGGKNEVEIAYGLMPQFWNRGLATEFVRTLIDNGFSQLGLDSIACVTRPDNIASQRVLEKTGFQYESKVIFKDKPHMLYRHKNTNLYPYTPYARIISSI